MNSDGVTGTYDSIDYDDDIEGPITDDPAEDIVSMTKAFDNLWYNHVIVGEESTLYLMTRQASGFEL